MDCCSRQQIVTIDTDIVCASCGIVHSQIEDDRDPIGSGGTIKKSFAYVHGALLPYAYTRSRGRLDVLNVQTAMIKRRDGRQLMRVVRLTSALMTNVGLHAEQHMTVRDNIIQIYRKLKQSHNTRIVGNYTIAYLGGILYYVLRQYGIRRSFSSIATAVDKYIYASRGRKIRVDKLMYRLLQDIELLKDVDPAMQRICHREPVKAETKHNIETEIYRLGHIFGIEHDKIQESLEFMNEFSVIDLSGKSPNTLGATFLYMVITNYRSFRHDNKHIKLRGLSIESHTTEQSIRNNRRYIESIMQK